MTDDSDNVVRLARQLRETILWKQGREADDYYSSITGEFIERPAQQAAPQDWSARLKRRIRRFRYDHRWR